MPDLHKNFAYSTVATAPSPATSGTTLVVAAGQGTRFPTAPFNATIWPAASIPTPANAEIVRVTGISTDTLTIVRAQEGSSARTIVATDQIAATITKKSFDDVEKKLFWTDVTDAAYGATGDGTTNDTTAVTAAITATAAGGVVYFPPGQYVIDAIAITKSLVLLGAGSENTFLIPNTQADFLKLNVGGGAIVYNTQLGDFSIYPKTNRTAGAALRLGYVGSVFTHDVRIGSSLGGTPFEGLRVDRGSDCRFSNLRVAGCASHGAVLAPGSSSSVIVEVSFDSMCEFNACAGDGIFLTQDYASPGASLEGIHFTGVTAYNNTGSGLRIKPNHASAIITGIHTLNCILDTNQNASGAGYLVESGSGTVRRLILESVWASANLGSGVRFDHAVANFAIADGFVQQNGKSGIYVAGAAINGRIQQVSIYDNAQSDTAGANAGNSFGIEIAGTASVILIGGNRIYNTTEKATEQNGIKTGASVSDIDILGNYVDTGAGTTIWSIAGTRVRRAGNTEGTGDVAGFAARGLRVLTKGGGGAADAFAIYDETGAGAKYFRMSGGDVQIINSAFGAVIGTLFDTGTLRMIEAIGTKHEGSSTPTGGGSGDIRLGTGGLWINDGGTWKFIPVIPSPFVSAAKWGSD